MSATELSEWSMAAISAFAQPARELDDARMAEQAMAAAVLQREGSTFKYNLTFRRLSTDTGDLRQRRFDALVRVAKTYGFGKS